MKDDDKDVEIAHLKGLVEIATQQTEVYKKLAMGLAYGQVPMKKGRTMLMQMQSKFKKAFDAGKAELQKEQDGE